VATTIIAPGRETEAANIRRSYIDGASMRASTGVDRPPENPLANAIEGWLVGCQAFIEPIHRLMKLPKYRDEVPAARRLTGVPLQKVLQRTADHHGVDVASLARKHRKQQSRDVAACLARIV
jgi:hypothetical protein